MSQREGAGTPDSLADPQVPDLRPTSLTSHAVLIGHGRVGSLVADVLIKENQPLLVIEERNEIADQLQAKGVEVISGNAAGPGVLQASNVTNARWLISAIPDAFESGNLIEQARILNPNIEIIARAHSDAEVEHLAHCGANLIIMGEREIARSITEHILSRISAVPIPSTDKGRPDFADLDSQIRVGSSTDAERKAASVGEQEFGSDA